ncbi:peptidoglycan DD-metalloendopeptidase family protein [Streptomyces boncukensis]|uniref:Peptidoglycan DD-metalloendopeptidase family protein n=1 Tax=Streptomyces boncukensis TaxID=2711219 RepID=A0A6G4X901_9ACTN|nr:peptidoglycan DD-metalloendopeptidase family protein [Streptomyces boncukensis]
MNDRHPSGVPSPDDPGSGFSYTAYAADYGQSVYGGPAPGVYGDGDPLFGALPGGQGMPAADPGTGQWTFGIQETAAWDTSGWSTGGWETAGWDTTPWDTGQHSTADYGYAGHEQQPYDGHTAYAHSAPQDQYPYPEEPYGAYALGTAYGQPDATGQWDFTQTAPHYGPEYGQEYGPEYGQEFGHDQGQQYGREHEYGYDTATGWGVSDTFQLHGPGAEGMFAAPESPAAPYEPYGAYDAYESDDGGHDGGQHDGGHDRERDGGPDTAALEAVAAPPSAARGRRRSPKPKPRRRAMLTVAVPSVAVLGVAGAAAATVLGGSGDGGDDPPPQASGSPEKEVKPSQANSKLDTQLAGLSADADDFADRASRTQERIDLKQRQVAERKRKAKEAARKEAMRPKYVIPVKNHTLSARYGQAGVNWMSIHTGIDFPVSYGTPVHAATDGVVTTKYDMSYGNMAIVTAEDGTQTWYCHLSSTKIRSGEVKAGDTIAYSGNSGNSTGPHLHFEVRPGGGSAVDPIPWLQGKGLSIS